MCLPLTSMIFNCILSKLPWSLIDIQLSIQYGDRKEQHSSESCDLICAYACFLLPIMSNVWQFPPCCSHFFTLWNTNLVVEYARYSEKVATFGLRLWCFTLFVVHNLLAPLLCLACLMVYVGYTYIWLWMLYIAPGIYSYMLNYLHPDGVISDLVCLLMPACLKFSEFLLFLISY